MPYLFQMINRQEKYVILIGLVFALLGAPSTIAQTTNYLDALDAEATELKLDDGTKSQQQSAQQPSATSIVSEGLNADQGGAISDLVPGLTQPIFEQVLEKNYIGSFLFYKRLNDNQKQQVYVFYQSNPDPDKVREKILQVSRN